MLLLGAIPGISGAGHTTWEQMETTRESYTTSGVATATTIPDCFVLGGECTIVRAQTPACRTDGGNLTGQNLGVVCFDTEGADALVLRAFDWVTLTSNLWVTVEEFSGTRYARYSVCTPFDLDLLEGTTVARVYVLAANPTFGCDGGIGAYGGPFAVNGYVEAELWREVVH